MCLGAFIQLAVKSASCMTVYVCSGRKKVLKQQKKLQPIQFGCENPGVQIRNGLRAV